MVNCDTQSREQWHIQIVSTCSKWPPYIEDGFGEAETLHQSALTLRRFTSMILHISEVLLISRKKLAEGWIGVRNGLGWGQVEKRKNVLQEATYIKTFRKRYLGSCTCIPIHRIQYVNVVLLSTTGQIAITYLLCNFFSNSTFINYKLYCSFNKKNRSKYHRQLFNKQKGTFFTEGKIFKESTFVRIIEPEIMFGRTQCTNQ